MSVHGFARYCFVLTALKTGHRVKKTHVIALHIARSLLPENNIAIYICSVNEHRLEDTV